MLKKEMMMEKNLNEMRALKFGREREKKILLEKKKFLK